MLALILYFSLSHFISFLCSIFEAVLLSYTPNYIALLKKKHSKAAPILEELKVHIDRPLAAILTLNTISHTIGAAGVGATVVELFGDRWLALGSIILTLTMLYWTEMLPKTIGALFWKKLAPICARPIQILIVITYPFVVSFNLIARLLGRTKKRNQITEEDILAALEEGTRSGEIASAEQDMVTNIFRLGDRRVNMLMRPRVDIDWIDLGDSPDKIRDKILASSHHRFPVCNQDIDGVIGIVDSQDLLEKVWKREKIELKKLALPPLFVNENLKVFDLLEAFRHHHITLALVTDEYGLIKGVITSGDIMRAIVRDIEDQTQSSLVKVDDTSYLIDGSYPIDEFKEAFLFTSLPDEERAQYRTLSGLCMHKLEHIPKKGEIFFIDPYRFEIVDVYKNRVEKILLMKEEKFN